MKTTTIIMHEEMVSAQLRIRSRKRDPETSLGLSDTTESPNLGQTTRPSDSQQIKKKKKSGQIMNIAFPADQRVKMKKSEKRDKYLNLAKELKILWDVKVTVIPVVIGALGTVTKGLIKGLEDMEIRGRVETIQTTALLKLARIMRRVLET